MPFLVAVIVLCLLLLLYARYIEPNLLVVRKLKLKSPRPLSNGIPLRIVLLSDFHYPRYINDRRVQRAIAKSNQFDPDLVFILGDFFDKNRSEPARLPNDVGSLFSALQSKRGIFGVLGNHDHWFGAQAIRDTLAARTTVQLIDNASVNIPLPGMPLYVTGIGDLWARDAHFDQAVAQVPPDALIILLSHNPDVVETIRDPRILIQFSGHTHGGQVRLPFWGALKVPSKFGNRYSLGLTDQGNHLIYVNGGIGSALSLRFLCPPEVTWVEIY